MNDCPDCPRTKHRRSERSRHSPRKRRYRAVSERRRKYSPLGCESCSEEDLRPHKSFYCGPCNPCPITCRGRCCSVQPEPGLLNTIRTSIQRIFSGRRPNQLYMYSMSQLRCIEQLVERLEEETCCFEGAIKQAQSCNCSCNIDCEELKCSLNAISDRLESVKCDLMCAKDCYDPCRDRCEFEFICCLTERVCRLERQVQELFLQLECQQTLCCLPTICRTNCRRRCCGSCKTRPKPCARQCCKGCDSECRVTCYDKPKCCGPTNLGKLGNICRQKGLCRNNSVIPVGVMLVKL